MRASASGRPERSTLQPQPMLKPGSFSRTKQPRPTFVPAATGTSHRAWATSLPFRPRTQICVVTGIAAVGTTARTCDAGYCSECRFVDLQVPSTVDVDDVETNGVDTGPLLGQPLTGETSDAFLFLVPDREDSFAKSGRRSSLDLDEGDDLGPTPNERDGDQIELARMTSPVALDNGVAMRFVPAGRGLLTEPAKGLIVCCHQERAGRTASS